MRLSMLPLLALCDGCQSFEGEYKQHMIKANIKIIHGLPGNSKNYARIESDLILVGLTGLQDPPRQQKVGLGNLSGQISTNQSGGGVTILVRSMHSPFGIRR